jgi:hypothetical protein
LLDTSNGQEYVPIVWNNSSRPGFNPNDEHMGSTTFGNANPMTTIGLAMPQDIKISRAGFGRVRVGDRA